MKCTEREVIKLVQELDNNNTGFVNYNEFLRYSYLCQMYIYHYKLELMIRERDVEGKNLVKVAHLNEILQTEYFGFPPDAIDKVLIEMLGEQDVQQIDRNCLIKIDTFMENLKA